MIRRFSSGGVVFKKLKNKNSELKLEWLITKSNPSDLVPGKIWRLPKGWLDDKNGGTKPGPLASGKKRATEKQLQKAAVKEVREEGGVKAKIVSKVATSRFFVTVDEERGLKFVTYYLMEFVRELPEGFDTVETSEVAWLEYETARKRLSYSGEREVLEKAKEILEQGAPRQENLV